MTSNLPPPVRRLPIYLAGFAVGQDIGLRLALDAICAELTREDERTGVAEATAHPSSSETKIHAYAAGRLMAVAVIVAARFRR
jgi:hypothetical protein